MTVSVDGCPASVSVQGQGPDILMLHGWGGCMDSFAPIAKALEKDFRVIRVDFPGFGQSPAPQEAWSVTEYADWTQKIIVQLGIAPCHIIAHSFGARVAILLASTRPQLVRRMLLTGAAGLIPKRKLSYYMKIYSYKLMKRMVQSKPARALLGAVGWDVEAAVKKRAGSSDYQKLDEPMRATFVRVVNQDLAYCLPQIKSPVFLFWGEEDADTPLSFARIMHEMIPDSGLKTYPGAGHFAYLERAPEFIAIARHFFSEPTSAGGNA